METVISDLLAKLEEQKADWLVHLKSWPPHQLQYRPMPTNWSALEILDHIVKTENAILLNARAGLAHPHRVGLTDHLRTTFLQKVFASDRRVKVPESARQVLPDSDLELATVCERWSQSRTELQNFAQEGPAEQLRQGLFKHPVGGWMGLEQILDFFSIHLVHHRYQLDRLAARAAEDKTVAL